jgi:hypothetical protein
MNGYIAIFKGKRLEVYSDSGIYDAKCKASEIFKTKTSNIDIYLCEKEGQQVYQTLS